MMNITRSSILNSFSDKQNLFTEVISLYKQTKPYILLIKINDSE